MIVLFIYRGLPRTNRSHEPLPLRPQAKFQQIADLGCRGFALLFDDIDLDLGDEDSVAFPSPGLAQADLANEIFKKLKRPRPFLFCPTEYCNSRARPSVSESPYLRVRFNSMPQLFITCKIMLLITGTVILLFRNPFLRGKGKQFTRNLLLMTVALWDPRSLAFSLLSCSPRQSMASDSYLKLCGHFIAAANRSKAINVHLFSLFRT